jgi:hypothetical protein
MPKSWETILFVTGIVCAILLCVSVLVAAINLGSHIAAGVVVLIFQIVLTICGVAISVFIAWWLCCEIINRATNTLLKISKDHAKTLKELTKRVPTFLTITAILTQVIMLIADKVFDNNVTVVMVSLVLMILFWIGNEFLLHDGFARIAGWIIWLGAAAFLPIAVMLSHNWNFVELWQQIESISLGARLVFMLSLPSVILLPLVMKILHKNS